MDHIQNGWFSEVSEMWPGHATSLEVEEVIHQGKSEFQDVLIFKSKAYGKVLVLDGIIQCAESDEFSYQEMITYLPLNSHPNPEKVLIIGGGDGGVAREVTKHPKVKEIVQCEIDSTVIELSKKYLPQLSVGYDSPKLTLHVGDGFEFMKKHKETFDVIITDSSDPIGPASVLFGEQYYALMKAALKPGGITCVQEDSIWFTHKNEIKKAMDACRPLYPVLDYGYTTIPSYPTGLNGFILCSLNENTNFREPVHVFTDQEKDDMKLQYYDENIHRAAFVLPVFARKAIHGH